MNRTGLLLWCEPCRSLHRFAPGEVERLVYAAQIHAGEADTGDDDSPWRGQPYRAECLRTFLAWAGSITAYGDRVDGLVESRERATQETTPTAETTPDGEGPLRRHTLVAGSEGAVKGRWTWDPARPWVVHLVVPDGAGGFLAAVIGRDLLQRALLGEPLPVFSPMVQVRLDESATVPTLHVHLIPRAEEPGVRVAVRTRRWRTSPTVARDFLDATLERVPLCPDPARCEGCPECAAITDRMAVLTARRGVT